MNMKMTVPMAWLMMLGILLLAGCGGEEPPETPAAGLEVTSAVFQQGATIPDKFARGGDNLSPPLAWSGAPEATACFALIVDDPDAPRGTFTHWLATNIPADVDALPEGMPKDGRLDEPVRMAQGTNGFKKIGYDGPAPPPGPAHRYFFRLYALDIEPDLAPGFSRDRLDDAMKGHILAAGELMGRYARQ
jgi:hypothetical protein